MGPVQYAGFLALRLLGLVGVSRAARPLPPWPAGRLHARSPCLQRRWCARTWARSSPPSRRRRGKSGTRRRYGRGSCCGWAGGGEAALRPAAAPCRSASLAPAAATRHATSHALQHACTLRLCSQLPPNCRTPFTHLPPPRDCSSVAFPATRCRMGSIASTHAACSQVPPNFYEPSAHLPFPQGLQHHYMMLLSSSEVVDATMRGGKAR